MLYRFIDLFSGTIVPLLIVLIIFGIVKRSGVKKTVLIMIFALYLSGVFDIVGIPAIVYFRIEPIVNMIPFSDLFKEGFTFESIFQFAANIILFIPFGVLLPIIWKSFRRFYVTVIAGVLVSIGIEFIQVFSFRVTALDDLLMNTLGTIIGYLLIAGVANKKWKCGKIEEISGKHDRIELFIVAVSVLICTIFVKYFIGCFIYNLPMF